MQVKEATLQKTKSVAEDKTVSHVRVNSVSKVGDTFLFEVFISTPKEKAFMGDLYIPTNLPSNGFYRIVIIANVFGNSSINIFH